MQSMHLYNVNVMYNEAISYSFVEYAHREIVFSIGEFLSFTVSAEIIESQNH